MGDEEVMGTLRIWLEFLFEHDDAVGMDMAVEVENLNISENQEVAANRRGDSAAEQSDSNDGAEDAAVGSQGHRQIQDEDTDTTFSSATSSSTTSSSSEDDVMRLVPYDESTDSGIDVPDSDRDDADQGAELKHVEHPDASDENSDDDPQPASSQEVPGRLEKRPGKHTGGSRDQEEDPHAGPSRKRRRKTPRDADSEDYAHGPPLKIVRKSDVGPSEQPGTASDPLEEEPRPGPSRRREESGEPENSDERSGPGRDHSNCDAEQTEEMGQKENQKDEAEED